MAYLDDKIMACPNCGAPINRVTMKCEYCGAVFKEDESQHIVFQVEDCRVVPLVTECRIEKWMSHVDEEELTKYAVNEMTIKLAKGLTKYMDVKMFEDPYRGQTIIQGRVRVVPPGKNIW